MMKIFSGCISYYKTKLTAQQRDSPRPDGKSPKEITAKLRLQARIDIQFAIAQGNAALALAVGL